MQTPRKVTICEVGTRDGFQMEPEFIDTSTKVEVVNRLSACGISRIQVTSFVHPEAVPQLRDAEEVMATIVRRPGTVYAALVPNERGARRAIEAGADELHTVVSASESHNMANVNMTTEDSLKALEVVGRLGATSKVPVIGGIATAFGCPFEGAVPVERLERIVGRFVGLGAQSVSLGDTTGMADPAMVSRTLDVLTTKFPQVRWTLHTHDTRAMAIPNVLAAIERGVTNLDASIGGLGGCPFAPGATGNVCTEDLVHCLHAIGIETGIDLDRLIETAKYVEEVLNRTLPGRIIKAGKSDRRYALPDSVRERTVA